MQSSGVLKDRNGAPIEMQGIVYWKGKRACVIGRAYDYHKHTIRIEMLAPQQRPKRRWVLPEDVVVEVL
jgi:hypothetical protein